MADIELVIKISEDSYKATCNGWMLPQDVENIVQGIKNGTPLPSHGRLIDADQAISKICGSACGCRLEECGYDKPCYSVARIKSAQTIIKADEEES